jgi:hypothetical protein
LGASMVINIFLSTIWLCGQIAEPDDCIQFRN